MELVRTILVCLSLAVSTFLFLATHIVLISWVENVLEDNEQKKSKERKQKRGKNKWI